MQEKHSRRFRNNPWRMNLNPICPWLLYEARQFHRYPCNKLCKLNSRREAPCPLLTNLPNTNKSSRNRRVVARFYIPKQSSAKLERLFRLNAQPSVNACADCNKSCNNGRGASVVSIPKTCFSLIKHRIRSRSAARFFRAANFNRHVWWSKARALKTVCSDAKRLRFPVRWAADGECASSSESESVCACVRVCVLDEQNAEEELSAEKRHSIQHTHTLKRSLKEQFVQGLILEIVQWHQGLGLRYLSNITKAVKHGCNSQGCML